MIKRKFLSAIFTFIISTILISIFFPPSTLLGESSGFIDDLFITGTYVGIGLLVYGLPVTFLIEWITNKIISARAAYAFPFYIFFGLLPVLVLGLLVMYSLSISLIYFLVDEALRRYVKIPEK
ncbi:hypothetical protein [Terribacillus saccharophilus]|uniref:hypothetical protein n=1 Tax=Terribacillus saccharophilus TaxID=361277 RepID=UPI002989E34F|nr:hypothetical protein [Terribacillus saccharophilus]MCM3225969.1 hypothetical protein [Terribacillus saccharophilus]